MVNISNLDSQLLRASAPQSGKLNLKAGQLVSITINQIKGDQAQITLGKQTFIADHKLNNLNTGSMEVRVKQVQPSLVLEVPRPKAAAQSPQNALPMQTLQKHYSQLIGNQMPVGQAIQKISLLPGLSQTIQSFINQITERLLKPSTISGKELKTQFLNSGLFLEHQLKQPDTDMALKKDTKAQLLTLQRMALEGLKKTPENKALQELSGLTAKSLNKLTIQQLQLLETPLHLNLELPLQSQNRFENFRVEIYKRNDHSHNKWEVLLEIKIQQHQTLFKLTYDQENHTLKGHVWGDDPKVMQTIQTELDSLKETLKNLGFHDVRVQITHSKPQQSQFSTQVALVDIKV